MTRTRGPATHNNPPMELADNAPDNVAKAQFANRLQNAMVGKGMSQADLLRAATLHLAPGKTLTRSSISQYIRGEAMPNAERLAVLAKALGMKPTDLLPARGVRRAENKSPQISISEAGNGLVWLQVNKAVPMGVAAKVMALIDETSD